MTRDPAKNLENACRESFFAGAAGLGYEEIDRRFRLFWRDHAQRLTDLASRCAVCLRFHTPAMTCVEYHAAAEKRREEHEARVSGRVTRFAPLEFEKLEPMPKLEVKTSGWRCRNSSCPERPPVTAAIAPLCYTCGGKMVRP